ncbi:MAG: P-loop NTPase fold protein [Clostridia bacterium]|nr:P-loop NTPase fold protein [Clostridia bacterium]
MEDLVESILDYIRADYTDYAIMINGEWGSGKTHFWNNKIRNKIESLQLNGKRYTTIYMSLYGISNLEDISKKIFMETTQLMDKNLRKFMTSKGQETIPEYAKTGIDMANFFGVTQSSNKLDYTDFFATDDKVLCFDDLERANVDVIDILGYINNFVEHDHIKTIIICNEKELATKLKSSNLEMKTFIATYLLDKQNELNKSDKPMVEKIQDKIEHVFDKANDYERIKEKLIGETFEYAPKFDYIINGILMRYENNKDLIRFLRANTKLIINTFHRSGTRNLRILKHALNDFKKVYEMVNKTYPNTNNRVMQTMLIFTIAVSFEIKAGKITKEKFTNINDNEEYKALLVSSRILMDNRQFYIKEFDNNYYYNFKSEYRFFKFIEIYVRTRIFDMKVFKDNMEIIRKTVDTGEIPAYKRLLTEEYWKISDDDFNNVIEDILEDVKQGKIKLIDIVKIFAYFSYFSRKGLINYDLKILKVIFFNGMNIASLTSDYCDNVEEELDKIAIEEVEEDMVEIIKHFNSLNEQLLDKKYREKADEVMKNIPMKMEQFYEMFDRECANIPIFKYYDPNQFFQRLSCASNEDVMLIKEKLIDRVDKYTKELEPETKNIKLLKQIIDDYLRTKVPTIKNVILKEFSKSLEYILGKYKVSFLSKKEEKTEEF